MSQCLLSVIVPIFNAENYLRKCIDSIVGQTYTNLEIILVDDGSTDNSIQICNEYAKADNRIKILHQDNQGQATARNLGLSISTGEFISFVDADDFLDVNMYADLIDKANDYSADIIMCGRYKVDEVTFELEPLFSIDGVAIWNNYDAIKRFLTYQSIDASPCDKVIRKSVIGDMIFPTGYISEDIPFVFNCILNANVIVHVGKSYYYYLQRTGSTSHPKSFSERTMGVDIYTNDVLEHIIKCYPSLKLEAIYYYFFNSLWLADTIIDCKADKKYWIYVRENMRKKYFTLMRIRYFSIKEKLKITLITLNLYPFIRGIIK